MLPMQEIKVLPVGMDARKLATYRMAFEMHSLQRFRLLDEADKNAPDVAVVDMDGVEPDQTWARFREQYPELPALIASTLAVEGAPAPVLTKPVRMESLFPLLRQVLAGETPEPSVDAAPAPRLRVVTSEAQDELPEEPPQPRASRQRWPDEVERFDNADGVLGALTAIRDKAHPAVVAVGGHDSLIVVPRQGLVGFLTPADTIEEACAAGAAVTHRPATRDDKPTGKNVKVLGLMPVLWQVALWSSRGRLASTIDPDAELRLRHWPNLTRLAPLPDALRMAAFLVRAPSTLPLTVHMLNVPPAQLFDFVTATHSIGLLEISDGAVAVRDAEQEMGVPERAAPTPAPPVRRGILSRLLRKVRGS